MAGLLPAIQVLPFTDVQRGGCPVHKCAKARQLSDGYGPGTTRPRGRLPQPLREQHHGLAIDLGAVPLAHHLEILRAFTERRARAPAVRSEEHTSELQSL